MVTPPRNRFAYALLFLFTIALGLASRHFSRLLPLMLAKNAGDILYATMAFWLVRLLFPRLALMPSAAGAFAFCVAIEFAKQIQTPWLVAVRHTVWGHLVLGTGFHTSNLVCYALGILLGLGIAGLLRPHSGVDS